MKSNFIKRLIVFALTPLTSLILVFFQFPDWVEYINIHFPAFVIYARLFTVVGTLFVYVITVWAPYSKFEKSEKGKWSVINDGVIAFNKRYNDKYKLSFNIMMPRRKVLHWIEPRLTDNSKGRWVWFGKVFKIEWEGGDEGVPPDFKMTVHQGVSGQAFREGTGTNPSNIKGAALVPNLIAQYRFNFTTKQEHLVRDLQMVASCPILVGGNDGNGTGKKRIGVLTVQSKEPGSENLILDPKLRKDFYQELSKLANIYKNLHV